MTGASRESCNSGVDESAFTSQADTWAVGGKNEFDKGFDCESCTLASLRPVGDGRGIFGVCPLEGQGKQWAVVCCKSEAYARSNIESPDVRLDPPSRQARGCASITREVAAWWLEVVGRQGRDKVLRAWRASGPKVLGAAKRLQTAPRRG